MDYKDDSRYRGGVIRSAESPPTGGERLNPESRLPVDNVEFGRAEPPVFEAPREPVGPPEPQPSNAGLFAPIPRQAPIKGGWGSQAPVIAPDMKEPRQALTVGQMADTRQIPVEAQAPAPEGVISAAAGSVSPGVSVVPGNPNYKAEYAAMRAQERQDMADLNEARARALALDNARYDAYYAKIAADNAARGVWKPSVFDQMITHASTVDDRPRGGDAGRVIQSAAAPAASEFTRQANLLSQKASPRNFVQEAADAEKAGIARASMGTAQQIEQIKLDQQKRLNDLGSKLAAAQDPKERERLSSSILALLGKDKPEEYQVIHVPGAESIGPDGITKLKGQDSVILFNKRSGSWQTLPVSTQGNQAAKSAGPADGSTGMYGGKHVVFRNGKWEYA